MRHTQGRSNVSDLLYEKKGATSTLTLNRPERLNAISGPMLDAISEKLVEADRDPEVRVIVLTGSGRGFCAGADLQGLKAIGEGGRMEAGVSLEAEPGDPSMGASFRGPYAYMFSVRKPIIAAINGPVAGLGFAIAMFADMRFASDRAVFTTAFAHRGLIAEWGIGWTLPRLVGPAHALDLLVSGRKIDAAEAERIGLVNRTLPHDELIPFVQQYVRELAEKSSPASMSVMKRQVYSRLTSELGPALDESIELMRESFGRDDFKEGVQSFLDKRPPRFKRV